MDNRAEALAQAERLLKIARHIRRRRPDTRRHLIAYYLNEAAIYRSLAANWR